MTIMMYAPSGYLNSRMRLYDEQGRRLYINAPERERFLKVAQNANLPIRAFCQTLLYTGCRLSEALQLTTASVDLDRQLISIRTLKKRDRHEVREVPIPPMLVDTLFVLVEARLVESGPDTTEPLPLWTHKGRLLNRVTGYRWVKNVLAEAGINGAQASPKGLRHGFGVNGILAGVPLNMLQRWLGHASMVTTAIYTNAIGSEEMEIAERMWE